MHKRNEKGFSVIELILILLFIAAIAFGGWYIYKTKHKDSSSKTSSSSKSESSSSSSGKKSDPTAGWTAYSNAPGVFSFKYPPTWVQATHPELCNEGLVLLGATAQTVGICATESFGQVAISSVDGDRRSESVLDPTLYTGITSTSVTVSGVSGTKMTGTAQNQAANLMVGGLPDGTTVVQYIFYTNNKTYALVYNQQPTYPDVLSNFELLVTNTFKFSV